MTIIILNEIITIHFLITHHKERNVWSSNDIINTLSSHGHKDLLHNKKNYQHKPWHYKKQYLHYRYKTLTLQKTICILPISPEKSQLQRYKKENPNNSDNISKRRYPAYKLMMTMIQNILMIKTWLTHLENACKEYRMKGNGCVGARRDLCLITGDNSGQSCSKSAQTAF